MRVKTITCPNCGHANNFLAEDCSQCGINFKKYYDDLEKAEALRRHIEEQEKAEALRKQQEEEEAQRQEERQRRKEEEARLEEERRKETEKRADMLRRQKEELEKAEELRRQKEDEERREEERRRKEEAEKAEALRKQREAEEEARRQEERQRRQEEEEARLEEERRRKEAAEKAEALRKQREAEEEARRQEEEEAEALSAEDLEGEAHGAIAPGLVQMPDTTPDFRPADTLQLRLAPYAGQMIGVTYGNPSEIQNVKLISVNTDHFQIYYPISKNVVSFAYRQLRQVTENAEGISAVGPDISPVFPVVIEVPQPFFYKS